MADSIDTNGSGGQLTRAARAFLPLREAKVSRRFLFVLMLSVAFNFFFLTVLGVHIHNRGGLPYVLIRLGLVDARPRPSTGEMRERLALEKALPIGSSDTVFLGDSLIESGPWAELFNGGHVRNRGVGGDRIIDVIDRLDPILAGRPAKIFLMVGTNDLGDDLPLERVLRNYARVLERIQKESPGTRVYVHSILPRYYMPGARPPGTDDLKPFNDGLRELAAAHGATYIDLVSHLESEQTGMHSRFTTDGLHLSTKGYLLWGDVIRPYVEEK